MTLLNKSIQLSDVQKAFSSGSAAAQAAFRSSVSSAELLQYSGDGSDLAAVLLASARGVSIRSSITVSATITVPAGKVVEIPAGVTYTKSGGGNDAFSLGGPGASVVGAGTISGGRYAINAGGQSGCAIGSSSRQTMLRIRNTVLHGIWIDGAGHLVAYCDIDAGQSGITMSGADNCVVHDNYLNACGNFGLWMATACHDNHIYKNWCDESGLELIGVTYDCHDNHIYENKARNTGDNGISVTGFRNTVENNECTGCKNHGIGIYGERNTVVGNYGKNNGWESLGDGGQYAGITCTPAFGGLARKNVIVGNHFDDDQPRPTQHCVVKIGTDAYVAWAAGQAVTNSNLYRKNATAIYRATGSGTTGSTPPTHTGGDVSDGGVTWRWVCDTVNSLARSYPAWTSGIVITDANRYQRNGRIVYRATAVGGTTGATPPTHTSGSVSDGGVTWAVYEECPNNLDAYDNTIVGNGGSGNVIADPVLDATTNRNLYFGVGRIQVPAPGRNQNADYIVGTGTPEGVVTAKPGSLYSRQDVSAQGIALWSKQSGTSSTGWLRVALQDGGTTAQRPAMAGYGAGARGYCYFDTTLNRPIWWSSSAWVDATGAAV